MTDKNAMIAGFEAGSGMPVNGPDGLSTFLKGTLAAVLLLIMAYIVISLYQDLQQGNTGLNNVMWIVVRVIVLISITFSVFI
ncbi:DUF3262 family protein [Actinobacillus delphinicola]|uniref:Integrating conjugative element protein, PFL_4701 family n=1 Tax=Actinobacillus delphinicola TaxID=51161 RepID=A0A448TTW8_9PAST|nr:DUF3262 family protein [Actinobacillus delphinicola]VEJ09386.1 integrating conjugative element protein, PFL_4701 family [Actinobacillus delphinicola]